MSEQRKRNNYYGMKDIQPSPLPKNLPLEACATVGFKMTLAQHRTFLMKGILFNIKARFLRHTEVAHTNFRKNWRLNVTSRKA